MKSEIKSYLAGVLTVVGILVLSSCGRENLPETEDTVITTTKDNRVVPIPSSKPLQTKKVKISVNPCG